MKHSHLLGNLPIHKSGSNKGRLDRNQAAKQLGISFEALHKGYNNWCQIFRKEGSTLTLDQYFNKLKSAGISVFDLGTVSGKYQLARYNDEGPYTNESCRFVPVEVNYSEQKRISPFQRLVNSCGYEAAAEQNRSNAHKGWKTFRARGIPRPQRTKEQNKKLSDSMKRVWHKRKESMSVDGKRGS